MIVLPAIPAIVAALTPVVQAALVSAGIGAAVSGGIGAVGEAVEGYREQGEINREVLDDAARGAFFGARDGAMIGFVLGPAGLVVGPIIGPAMQVVDDVAQPAIQFVDDAAKSAFSAVDDVAGPSVKQMGKIVHRATMTIEKEATSALRSIKRRLPSPIRKLLPKTRRSTGYVYLMDDAGSGAQKIGQSVDPKRRLGELKSPSGAKPKIACTIPTYNMKALEDSLHAAYASQNLPNSGAGREWFKLSASQVKAICN